MGINYWVQYQGNCDYINVEPITIKCVHIVDAIEIKKSLIENFDIPEEYILVWYIHKENGKEVFTELY